MKNTLNRIAMVCVIAALPLTATAAMQIDEAEAAVKAMLGEGASADQVIEALVEDGRSLRVATATAVNAASGDNQIDLAKAGICASTDTAQAEKVGQAAIDVAGATSLIDQIEGAIETYDTGGCAFLAEKKLPPSIYSPTGTGTGGGSVGVRPGGIPTPGGVIPPSITSISPSN